MEIGLLLFLTLLLTSAALCYGLTKPLISYLKQRRLDIPNARSNHNTPTPRGGGLAIIIVLALCYLANMFSPTPLPLFPWPVFLAFMALALLSWVDDRYTVSSLMRLVAQAACVGFTLWFLRGAALPLLPLPPALLLTVVFLGWLWFINLYNFMDGIDGITGVETLSILLGIVILSFVAPPLEPLLPGMLLLMGCCIGFLFHNWHRASIFLGDVGSITVGFLVGWYLLALSAIPGGFIPTLILPMYYLLDSGYTLLKRAVNREKIWQAHSQHYYQQAVRRGASHDSVALRIAGLNSFLILLAVLSYIVPGLAWLMLLLSVAATIILMRHFANYEF